MNIVKMPSTRWQASVRECGTEYGGDHHVYVNFRDSNGTDCRDGKSVTAESGATVFVYDSAKPLGEPAINIPMWNGQTLTISASDGSDFVVVSCMVNGRFEHKSFYIEFTERKTVVNPTPTITTPTTTSTDFETRKQSALSMLKQALAMVESL